MLLLGVRTEKEWINSIVEIPVLGHIFIFAFIFIPPVIASFLTQLLIPALNNDIGFTKTMFILLPSWNFVMWLIKIRLFVFFVPSWLLLGVIAILKVVTNDY